MKKLFYLSLFLFISITSKAGKISVINDSISYLRNQNAISVSMDYSEAIFNPKKVKKDENGQELSSPIVKGDNFNTYLKICRRVTNWERESLEYFCEWFNDELTSLTACVENNNAKYEIVVKIKEVYKDGNIKAMILLKERKTNKLIEMFDFKSSDGDAKDEIALRDPMKDTGKTVGKTIKKLLNLQ